MTGMRKFRRDVDHKLQIACFAQDNGACLTNESLSRCIGEVRGLINDRFFECERRMVAWPLH
jgi:hypothetical protein